MIDLFKDVQEAPADAILGIKQVFKGDPRPQKVDLSIGVYQDDNGDVPALEVVQEGIKRIPPTLLKGGYLPIEGLPEYLSGVQSLLFGDNASVLQEKRVVTVQSSGGTGALRYGADFLKRYFPNSTVYISNPTWNNHRSIFERVGFVVDTYPYYDSEIKGLNFEALRRKLSEINAGDIVIFHACCHNPSGVDLSTEEWREVVQIAKDRSFIPFLDFAYQGFANGIEEDALPLREFAAAGVQFLVANSFSKNLSLYRRRIGALSLVCADAEQAKRVLTQIRTDVRTNNSNPPIDGAAIVATVLNDAALRLKWEQEVSVMRDRITNMRQKFVDALVAKGVGERFKHLLNQRGMFSFSGLSKKEVETLRDDYAIYALLNGRICVAAMNERNIAYVAESIAKL